VFTENLKKEITRAIQWLIWNNFCWKPWNFKTFKESHR